MSCLVLRVIQARLSRRDIASAEEEGTIGRFPAIRVAGAFCPSQEVTDWDGRRKNKVKRLAETSPPISSHLSKTAPAFRRDQSSQRHSSLDASARLRETQSGQISIAEFLVAGRRFQRKACSDVVRVPFSGFGGTG